MLQGSTVELPRRHLESVHQVGPGPERMCMQLAALFARHRMASVRVFTFLLEQLLRQFDTVPPRDREHWSSDPFAFARASFISGSSGDVARGGNSGWGDLHRTNSQSATMMAIPTTTAYPLFTVRSGSQQPQLPTPSYFTGFAFLRVTTTVARTSKYSHGSSGDFFEQVLAPGRYWISMATSRPT